MLHILDIFDLQTNKNDKSYNLYNSKKFNYTT